MSRTLNDDFDDDDADGDSRGPLDLEKGSAQVGAGGVSSYGGDSGMDFDDGLDGDEAGAALELDIPGGGRSHQPPAPSKAPAPPQGMSGAPGAQAPHGVPDLAFDAVPPSSRDAARTSGAHRPAGASGAPAPAGPPGAPGSHPALPPSPQSSGSLRAHASGGESSGALPQAPHSSGQYPRTDGSPGSDPRIAAHGAPAEPARPNHAATIGKYPPPPAAIWQSPIYAVRVIMRQFEIRSDLESLRRRRSPDVPLYEAALRSYDAKSFRLGLAINIAAFTVATLIFFMPVFLRFLRND